MRRLLRRRPSAAMLVAIAALVAALSGTAVAASTLVRGDSLIKKRSLSGNRLKNHTVSGLQIKVSSLPTVPSANTANTAKAAPISQVTYVSANVTVANNGGRPSATAACPSGTTVLAGGASIADVKNGTVHQSFPSGKTGWTAIFGETGAPTAVTTGTVFAICAPAAATAP